MPMRQRKLDHSRLVRQPELLKMRRNYTREFVHKCILVFLSAEDYVKADPSARCGVPIVRITQGNEPLPFTGWFQAWDPKMFET